MPINSLLIGETVTTNAKFIANHFNTLRAREFEVFKFKIWEKRVLSDVSVKVVLCSGWEDFFQIFTFAITLKF